MTGYVTPTTWEQCARHVEAGGIVEVFDGFDEWLDEGVGPSGFRSRPRGPGIGTWEAPRRLVPIETEATGAERYLAGRLDDPEYAEAYRKERGAIDVPDGYEAVWLPSETVDEFDAGEDDRVSRQGRSRRGRAGRRPQRPPAALRPGRTTREERTMSEEREGWRECADPVELAAAVAAGVEVLCVAVNGRTWETGCEDSESFRRCLANDCRYRVPASWSWSPEPPATVTGDDLRERIAQAIWERDGWGDPWVTAGHLTHTKYRRMADAVLAVLPPQPTPPPVPPWPGAVLSGLCDEDGVPTWLAQAGQVRGEQVRLRHLDDEWATWATLDGDEWVEVRAPRAVPVPETERVPWWEARDRLGLAGDPFVEVGSDDEGPWVRVVEGGTKLHSPVDPDGTVEVLARDGDQ